MNQANGNQTIPEIIKAFRWLSHTRLTSFTGKNNIVIEDDTADQIVKSHWMSMILGVSGHSNVTFRSQFTSKHVAQISGKSVTRESETTDFGKEFCNLTLGGFKILFEKHGISMGTSLPIVSRGFDSVYFPRVSSGQTAIDNWKLTHESSVIYCDVFIELFKPISFKFDESHLTAIDGSVELF